MCVLSSIGMLLIALTPAYTQGGTISSKMIGVVLASLSSGIGEMSFLGLTHFYGHFSLAAWGSGTGGAGLIGAGAYAVATTSIGLSSKDTIFASAFLPIIMLASFFLILPRVPLGRQTARNPTGNLSNNEESMSPRPGTEESEATEEEGLLQEDRSSYEQKPVNTNSQSWSAAFIQNLHRSRSLFFP